MSRRVYTFDSPDRFVTGTVGEPGNRTFFLQARKGGDVVSVALEKTQVAVLAQQLDALLDILADRGVEGVPDERRSGPGRRRSARRAARGGLPGRGDGPGLGR